MAASPNPNRTIHRIVVFGLSDRGLQRGNNEDHFMVVDLTRKLVGVHENQMQPELFHHDIGVHGTLLLVADGLGGHEGGEIASQMTVETMAQALVDTADKELPLSEQLSEAVAIAHRAICQLHGASGRTRHMASTVTAVHVGQGLLTIAQVGDSRAYRFSEGKLTLLTEDQTVVYMMQKKGMLTPEEAQNHPHRNVILQALGQAKSVLPEIQTLPYRDNDYLLLCSDGLSSYVEHQRIEEIITSSPDEHWCCRHLVDEANALGGADNVTVLLARLIIAEPEPPQTLYASDLSLAPQSQAVEAPARRPQAPEVTPPPASQVTGNDVAPSKSPEQAAVARAPRSTKAEQPAAVPPTKISIWKREIRWPWGRKEAREPSKAPVSPPSVVQSQDQDTAKLVRPGQDMAPVAWEPQVLKAVEDALASYLGPLAKILVERAAAHTTNLHDLCRLLTPSLESEQERAAFLRSVLLNDATHPHST